MTILLFQFDGCLFYTYEWVGLNPLKLSCTIVAKVGGEK